MDIVLFAASLIIFIVFVATSSFIYRKKEELPFTLRNHFPFELWQRNKINHMYLNVMMFIPFMLAGANFILFAIQFYDVSTLVAAFMAVTICFSSCALFIIPLSKLKEHCILAILLMTFSAILSGFLIYKEVKLWKVISDNLLFLPIVINALLGAFALIAMFHPSLFRFNMTRDEEGNLIRPHNFILTISEWVLMASILVSQISIVIVRIVS